MATNMTAAEQEKFVQEIFMVLLAADVNKNSAVQLETRIAKLKLEARVCAEKYLQAP